MKSFIKGFFITLLVIAAIVGGGYFLLQQEESTAAKETVDQFTSDTNKFQMLIIGVDSLNAKKAENTRSDVMMILDVDRKNDSIRLLSVPRDSRVSVEGHEGKTKINHAYAYGGSELSLKTVNQNLGLEIPYYMVIDYAFVKDVVDIMGGIDVDVPMDMKYEDPTADPPLYIDLKQGPQTLNGDEALQFLRFRKGYANADLDRVKVQQQFMSALVNKLKSKSGVLHSPQLLVSYMDHTNSNMPLGSVVRMGFETLKIGQDRMTTATLPGTPQMVDGISYYILDMEQTDSMLKDLKIK